MPHQKKHRKSSSKSSSEEKKKCSRSRSISVSSCDIVIKKHHKKHHKKHESKSKSCDKKSKSKSCDKKSKSKSCDKKDFDYIYKRYKNALICDPSLMISGSDGYISVYSQIAQTVPPANAVRFDDQQISRNILHNNGGYGNYLRKSGVYCAEFVANCQDPSQFIFVNNTIPNFQTAVGRNAGGGNLINHQLLTLKDQDDITIRNYLSSAGTVTLGASGGGTLIGTNTELVLHKIAPHPDVCKENCCDKKKDKYYEKKLCKLSKKKKCLFEKLLCTLKNDPDIQLGGEHAYGTFYRNTTLSVPLNTAVQFELQSNVVGLVLQPNNSDILITMDGIYNFMFLVECDKPAQFTFFQNSLPILNTTSGLNKATNQIYLRQILELHQGDLINIQNYISSVGTVNILADTGGSLSGTNCILLLERISPIPNPSLPVCDDECCDLPKDIKLFKKYLEKYCDLMPKGSDAYFNIIRTTLTTLNVGDLITFAHSTSLYNVGYQSGTKQVIIEKDGIYVLYLDFCMDKSAQFTIFVNGVPNTTTTNGTNSAEGQSSIRQIVALNKGDILTVVNYSSFLTNISTVPNAGGQLIGNAITFSGYKIAPLCVPPPKPHC